MADTDSNAHRLKDQRNIFDKTHAFLDPHIRLVKVKYKSLKYKSLCCLTS